MISVSSPLDGTLSPFGADQSDPLFGYSIPLADGTRPRPISVWDAAKQIAAKAGEAIPLQTLFANTRNGTATYVDASGAVVTQTALNSITNHYIDGVAHALFQPSRVNNITNQDFAGATVGVIGAGGALPTSWEFSAPLDTVEVLEIGTHPVTGLPAIRLSISLDNTAGAAGARALRQTFGSPIAVSAGDKYTTGVSLNVVSSNASVISLAHIQSSASGFVSASTQLASLSPGWQEVTLLGDVMDATVTFLRPYAASFTVDAGLDFAADFWVSAPQTEPGAFATTPIPTSGSAVTRLADAASCALTTLPVDTSGGTIFIEGRAYYDAGSSDNGRVFQIDDGTSANRVNLTAVGSSSALALVIVAGGATQAYETLAYTSGAPINISIRLQEDSCVMSLNGSNSGADTSATLPPGMTHFRWGTDENGGSNNNAVAISKFRSFDYEFTTAEMDAETGA